MTTIQRVSTMHATQNRAIDSADMSSSGFIPDKRGPALKAKHNRNTGPAPTNLTQRGRITKYQTKG